MAKRWMGKALLGGLLASVLSTPVEAQQFAQFAQSAPTDPVPVYRAGPATPGFPAGVRPAGAESIHAMPAEAAPGWTPPPMPPVDHHTGVMSEEAFKLTSGAGRNWALFASVGWIALKRDNLGDSALSLLNPSDFEDVITPSPGAPEFANFDDLETTYHSGVRATVGFFTENASLEATAWHVGEGSDDVSFGILGRQFLFFHNPPLGFEGDLGLWNNADLVILELETMIYNVELNYRRAGQCCGGCVEFLIGARYLDVQERLSITTDDDVFLLGGITDLASRATYSTRTHNHMYGAQAGFALRVPLLELATFSWEVKGAIFANQADVEVSLVRADGLIGREGGADAWHFAHAYEQGFWIDVCYKNVRVRGGYQLLWVLNVAEAVEQIDYNLENANGKAAYRGSIFYHGPSVMVEFMF